MPSLNIETKGKPITVHYSLLYNHPTLNIEMAIIQIDIGDTEINIKFGSWDEMIFYCKKHNIKYKDQRSAKKVEKL